MRIISGSLKGQKLFTPENKLIRPTSDRAREMIFSTLNSILEDQDKSRMTVLDGFCGTGSLGIESFSRGFKSITFIDNSQDSIELVKKNCSKFKIQKECSFIIMDLNNSNTDFKKKFNFDIFFLDPPYKKKIIKNCLELLIKHRWVSKGSLGIIELAKDQSIGDLEGFELIKKKKIGISVFYFLKIP